MLSFMQEHPHPPAPILTEFNVKNPHFIAETGLAYVWRVTRDDGSLAALKRYHKGARGNEAFGTAYLEAVNGRRAVHVYAQTPSMVLMEWLPGLSLGDVARAGEDMRAAHELAGVAKDLLSVRGVDCQDWPKLDAWFRPLLNLNLPSTEAPDVQRLIGHSQDIATPLVHTQRDQRPLHGDLHHDNVRQGVRGFCAFDAKGVVGECAFELANAFRHPRGRPDLVRDPVRITALRDLWSTQLDIDANRLMAWAVAKTALSIVWRSAGDVAADPELDLLDRLLAVYAAL